MEEYYSDEDIFDDAPRDRRNRKGRNGDGVPLSPPAPCPERSLAERLRRFLVGVPPPPSLLEEKVPDSASLLRLWEENKEEFSWTKGPRIMSPREKKSCEKTYGITLNLRDASEELELLRRRYAERCVSLETDALTHRSSFASGVADTGLPATHPPNAKMTESAKKRARRNGWLHSPGSRLNYLARRRSAFGASGAAGGVLGSGGGALRTILIDAKKTNSERSSKSSVGSGPRSGRKPAIPKRALFLSPDSAGKKGGRKEDKEADPFKSPDRSRKGLGRVLWKRLSEVRMRERGDTTASPEDRDEGGRTWAMARSKEGAGGIRRRSLASRSLTFADQPPPDQLQLDKQDKKRLLWAVSLAIKEGSLSSSDPRYKEVLASLFKSSARMWLSRGEGDFESKGSRSEAMLEIARAYMPSFLATAGAVAVAVPPEGNLTPCHHRTLPPRRQVGVVSTLVRDSASRRPVPPSPDEEEAPLPPDDGDCERPPSGSSVPSDRRLVAVDVYEFDDDEDSETPVLRPNRKTPERPPPDPEPTPDRKGGGGGRGNRAFRGLGGSGSKRKGRRTTPGKTPTGKGRGGGRLGSGGKRKEAPDEDEEDIPAPPITSPIHVGEFEEGREQDKSEEPEAPPITSPIAVPSNSRLCEEDELPSPFLSSSSTASSKKPSFPSILNETSTTVSEQDSEEYRSPPVLEKMDSEAVGGSGGERSPPVLEPVTKSEGTSRKRKRQRCDAEGSEEKKRKEEPGSPGEVTRSQSLDGGSDGDPTDAGSPGKEELQGSPSPMASEPRMTGESSVTRLENDWQDANGTELETKQEIEAKDISVSETATTLHLMEMKSGNRRKKGRPPRRRLDCIGRQEDDGSTPRREASVDPILDSSCWEPVETLVDPCPPEFPVRGGGTPLIGLDSLIGETTPGVKAVSPCETIRDTPERPHGPEGASEDGAVDAVSPGRENLQVLPSPVLDEPPMVDDCPENRRGSAEGGESLREVETEDSNLDGTQPREVVDDECLNELKRSARLANMKAKETSSSPSELLQGAVSPPARRSRRCPSRHESRPVLQVEDRQTSGPDSQDGVRQVMSEPAQEVVPHRIQVEPERAKRDASRQSQVVPEPVGGRQSLDVSDGADLGQQTSEHVQAGGPCHRSQCVSGLDASHRSEDGSETAQLDETHQIQQTSEPARQDSQSHCIPEPFQQDDPGNHHWPEPVQRDVSPGVNQCVPEPAQQDALHQDQHSDLQEDVHRIQETSEPVRQDGSLQTPETVQQETPGQDQHCLQPVQQDGSLETSQPASETVQQETPHRDQHCLRPVLQDGAHWTQGMSEPAQGDAFHPLQPIRGAPPIDSSRSESGVERHSTNKFESPDRRERAGIRHRDSPDGAHRDQPMPEPVQQDAVFQNGADNGVDLAGQIRIDLNFPEQGGEGPSAVAGVDDDEATMDDDEATMDDDEGLKESSLTESDAGRMALDPCTPATPEEATESRVVFDLFSPVPGWKGKRDEANFLLTSQQYRVLRVDENKFEVVVPSRLLVDSVGDFIDVSSVVSKAGLLVESCARDIVSSTANSNGAPRPALAELNNGGEASRSPSVVSPEDWNGAIEDSRPPLPMPKTKVLVLLPNGQEVEMSVPPSAIEGFVDTSRIASIVSRVLEGMSDGGAMGKPPESPSSSSISSQGFTGFQVKN